ncbi:MAG TPA: O-methyltransferase [Longimicrobiales bacterium]|nr:O-methyltransferase [Longimicrobiales bacterium]
MSQALPRSYTKFDYALRPSKQVERKLIIEILHTLNQDVSELKLREYQYVGFGSPYYTDFILFHKYLYITRMVCVEGTPIPKRMAFNKPYEFIKLWMGPFSGYLPSVDRETPAIVWLDYDTQLSRDHLSDIEGACNVLPPGSFLFVTVDADVRVPDDLDVPERSDDQKTDDTAERYSEEFGRYLSRPVARRDLTYANRPLLFATVCAAAVRECCQRRSLGYQQLLNVRYADGAQMVSIGGLIGTKEQLEAARRSSVHALHFVGPGPTPLSIAVPPLTVRERLWLEQHLEGPELEFELDEAMAESFRKLYRYYPVYNEALL